MFFKTFSGTLGVTAAIGLVIILVLWVIKNILSNNKKAKTKAVCSFKIDKNNARDFCLSMTQIFCILIGIGFIPSCIAFMPNNAKTWKWVYFSGNLVEFLFWIAILFVIMIILIDCPFDIFREEKGDGD